MLSSMQEIVVLNYMTSVVVEFQILPSSFSPHPDQDHVNPLGRPE